MKRSRVRRRGLQRGVQRHKIAGRIAEQNHSCDEDEDPGLNSSKPSIHRKQVEKVLDKWRGQCFGACSFVCYKLCLVALTSGSDGRVQPAALWKRIIQPIIYGLIGSSVVFKTFLSFNRVGTAGPLDFVTFLFITATLPQVVGICVGSGAIFRPKLTMGLINSSVDMRSYLTELRNGRPPPSSSAASIQVIMTTVGVSFAIFGLASFSLYFTSAPIFAIDMLQTAGIISIQHNSLPEWLWRVLLVPTELFQYGVPLASYTYSGLIVMEEVGLMNVYINELRCTAIGTLEQRKKVESMYITFQLHNKLLNDWIRPILFPILLGLGCAVVFFVYLPLKHHELPGLIALLLVALAALIMTVLYWLCFDEVTIIRNSEGVLQELRSQPTGVQEFSPVQTQRFLKRAKALRPFSIAVGTFGEFNLEVPEIMWEEILNQLMLLLSF